jgi:hypothetical protein
MGTRNRAECQTRQSGVVDNRGELVGIIHAKRQPGDERHRVDVVERRVIHLDRERDFGSLRIV